MAKLTTKIALVANDAATAQRALAAVRAAVDRRAHGFAPGLLARILPLNGTSGDEFARLCDRVPMDPESEPHLAEVGTPAAGLPEAETYSFVLRLIDSDSPPPNDGATPVIVKIVTGEDADPVARYREVASWLNESGKDEGAVRAGVWVILAQVKPTAIGPQEDQDNRGADENGVGDLDHSVFLKHELCTLVERLASAASVVMSVGNFEYYLLDAYERKDGRLRRPFELARDRGIVGRILAGLLRQAPHLRQLVSFCAARQSPSAQSAWLGRIAVVQPMSSNGFFADDGAPNVDRVMGLPLLTPDGMIEDFVWGTRPSPFPRTDNELPAWVPYLTADAVLSIALGRAGGFAFPCDVLDQMLPKVGGPPAEATN